MQTLAPTWNVADAATPKWFVKLLPSLNDVAFILPILILFTRLNGTQTLFADGDTGWHIRTGEWILAHRAVPTQDLFSFTKSHAAWFAWEWLWDILAAAVHHYSGLGGLAFVTTVLLGASALLIYRLCLRLSQNHVMSIVATTLAIATSSIHWLARPHLVTWLFALIFLHVLESARLRGKQTEVLLTFILPVLMMLWTNLHGGFVAGLIIIACYALGQAVTAALKSEVGSASAIRRSMWQASSLYWRSLFLCALATLVNPYGWQLHRHVIAYLLDSELLDKIQEFQSISFHAGPAIFFEILLLLAVCALLENVGQRQATPVLLMGVWAHFALKSARHIPLFAIVAAPFVAAFLAAGLERIRRCSVVAGFADALTDISHDLKRMERLPRLHLASAVCLILVASLIAIGQEPFAPQFNKEAFPVQAIGVIENHPKSRIFTTDQWADYILYRLYPRQRVFFDGRSDFYGADFVKVNERIFSTEHDWKSLLQSFAIDLVVLKPETALSAVLKLTPGAKVLFDDGKVIVMDIGGIYGQAVQTKTIQQKSLTQVSRTDKSAIRAPRLSPAPQPVLRAAAFTINHTPQL